MVILTVRSKKFGKNFIDYDVFDTSLEKVIRKGKCNDFLESRAIYTDLQEIYGNENVMLLTK